MSWRATVLSVAIGVIVGCRDDDACTGAPERCCGAENTDELCSDGRDNDDNGFTDCDDWHCGGIYVTACEPVPDPDADPEDTLEMCSDGQDNDGDGATDCDDSSCALTSDPDVLAYCARGEVTFEQCSNGRDDDFNGFADCNDFSCSDSTDPAILSHCHPSSEASFEACRGVRLTA